MLKQNFLHDPQQRAFELFGLQNSDISKIIELGYLACSTCTDHHPKTYRGFMQWGETVRALRDITIPKGWTFSEESNLPISHHPEGQLDIIVQSGDIATGKSGYIASNKAQKGPLTAQAVLSNQYQITLFDLIGEQVLNEKIASSWILLYFVDKDEIRYELSKPKSFSKGKITAWEERIIFSPIQIDQTYTANAEEGIDFDVPVISR